ncbi:ABC transporter permease [Leifsonia shinshuensis]|uniref:Peptide/nickel transport system permease protein n=1 Tax=Leifsonia shinshuensis TaxID=150026 RepID=A0A853CP95_9MICO|nr:peptide/nickel transport system permease protein [Leifsonia shinshuensis]
MTTTSPRLRDADPSRGRGLRALAPRHLALTRLAGRRLVQIPLVLLVVSVLVFWLVQVVPGDPGRNALGPYATATQVAAWNNAHGLDGSIVERYLHWLGGFVTGDWGVSLIYAQPASELILGRLGNSLLLGLYAFVIVVPVAIALGAVQAYREGRRTDRLITVVLMSLSAVPEFVIGVVFLIVFSVWLGWVPVSSAADATSADPLLHLRAMTLPAITLALGYLAVLVRMVRTGTLETLTSQYHRTAVLKGLPPSQVVRSHVARNALIPTISLLGIYLGTLLGGSAIVESLFGYPGLGALLVTATQKKDIVLLEAGVMVTGVVSLLALLLTDLVFALVDPRIRFDAKD